MEINIGRKLVGFSDSKFNDIYLPASKYWFPGRPEDVPQTSYLTIPETSRSDVLGTS